MPKIFTYLSLFLFTSAIALYNAESATQVNCGAAYSQLIGASRSVEAASNNLYNIQTNYEAQVERQEDQYQNTLINFALRRDQINSNYELQKSQIETNRENAQNYNRGNLGSCAVNSFFFGFRVVNCVPGTVNSGINIQINYNNQINNLNRNYENQINALNRDIQNYVRFITLQKQRFAANYTRQVQSQTNFLNVQQQRCFAAKSRADSCIMPPANSYFQAPEYPAVSCSADDSGSISTPVTQINFNTTQSTTPSQPAVTIVTNRW